MRIPNNFHKISSHHHRRLGFRPTCAGALLGVALFTSCLPAAEKGSPYWHDSSFTLFPDQGELPTIIAIPTIHFPDGRVAGPVTSYEDQYGDMVRTDSRLRADSYGQAWLRWEIYPGPDDEPLDIDWPHDDINDSNVWGIPGAAAKELKKRGVDATISNFRFQYTRTPGPQGQGQVPGWSALGHAGGGAQWHEMCHNMGFGHGSDGATPITSAGGGHFSAPMRATKRWIREGEGFTQVSESGVYRIYDILGFTEVPDKPVGLVIRRMPHSPCDLWLEYRPTQWEELENVVRLIDYGDWGINEPSAGRTINTQPPDDNPRTYGLRIGDSWTDSDRTVKGQQLLSTGATIETLQVNDTTPRSIDVRITFDERPNQPPEVTLRSSYSPTTAIPVGTPVTLTAEGSDEEGEITKVEWSVNGLAFPASGEPPYTLELSNEVPNTTPTRYTVRMYDEDGVMSESAFVVINVIEPEGPERERFIRMAPLPEHVWIDENGDELPIVDEQPTAGPSNPDQDRRLRAKAVIQATAADNAPASDG